MPRKPLLALLLMAAAAALCPVPSGSAAPAPDTRWHFPEATHRALVRVTLPATAAPLGRPVRVSPAGRSLPAHPGGWRAWDLSRGCEAPAQAAGDEVLVDPGKPLAPGQERRFFLYACPKAPAAAPAVRVGPAYQVETDTYVAQVDAQQGGAIKSLLLKEGEKRVETLGDGIHWWLGRPPQQKTQESFGALPIERTAAGPVFAGLRVTYPNLLAEGNSLVTEYRFFRDFIEIDHHYAAKREATLVWFKIPVSVRAAGPAPGVYSNSAATDQAMRTAGPNKWVPDDRWHDVSYLGPEPFGLGVIARQALGGLFYMDSGRADEKEWIYAEPFGWEKPRQITADFDVKLTLVPHAAGRGRSADTLAKVESSVSLSVSAFQAKGGPPLDTDGDGLTDLAELTRGTNANCADTDGDGTPDGKDADPLGGPAPRRSMGSVGSMGSKAGSPYSPYFPYSPTIHWPAFKAQPTSRPQTIAKVQPVGGVPTLVLDGKPYGPMVYTRCAGTWEQLAEIGDRNFPVHFEMVGGVGWPGEQMDTFRRLDQQLNRFLDEVPNARIILRLYVCNPKNFARNYPKETMLFEDGSPLHYNEWYSMKDRPLAERGYPSFASDLWRQKTAEALHNYVTHVRQSEYSRNVIGYFVCGGGTEEWYYWGDYDHNNHTVDFSPPMLKAFRTYLRAKYAGDVRRLRAAWNDPAADFGTALPPGPERFKPSAGAFWDPAKSQRIRDYYFVHNKAMEDSLLIFSRAVKQACAGQQLMGMFHGYLQNHWLLEGGQSTLKDLLRSPDVDFWSGPPQYDRRGSGEHGCVRFLMASLKQHGKLWISESDIRTVFSEKDARNPALYGRQEDVDESVACLQREYAHQLCEGGNGWWFQMGKNWYHQEPILSLFDKMQRGGEAAMAFDRTGDTDIAAVVDLDSFFTGPSFPISTWLIDAFKVQETCRIGAPVDHWELDDILASGAKRYKLYLMLNCFSLSKEKRRLIEERLRRDGATLVWMYAPGFFNPDATPEMAAANTKDLLGFPLETETGEGMKVQMKLTPEGARFFAGFDPNRAFGSFERPAWSLEKATGGLKHTVPGDISLRQRFYGPEGGDVLARFVDGGRPSIAARQTPKATDLWIGSVMAPADLLRTVARRAGCHLFCDGDEIVYANKSFLAIHTRAAGERTFRLRRKSDVVEIFTGDVLGQGVGEFKENIGAYRTRVYFLGDRARWESERRRADGFFARFQEELKAGRQERAARPRPAAMQPATPVSSLGPRALDKDGMVTSFLFCGPFPSKGSGEEAAGYAADFIGEAACRPSPIAKPHEALFQAAAGAPEAAEWFGGKAGEKRLTNPWLACVVSSPTPYLKEQFPALFTDQNVAYYVACYVEVPAAQDAFVGIGSDDGFKLWVNGQFLGGENASRSLGIDTNRYPVKLRAGRNLVLLKVVQGGGPSGWSLRLSDAAGNPLKAAKVWLAGE